MASVVYDGSLSILPRLRLYCRLTPAVTANPHGPRLVDAATGLDILSLNHCAWLRYAQLLLRV
ncbi:MAG: hypothetical protein ACKO2P_01405 [Planctomycetota bacterium]